MKKRIFLLFLLLAIAVFITGFKDKDESESSKYPGMVRIPAGSFEMGSNDGESDEKPVHTVSISEFWMDKYEVTNGEYKKGVNAGVCRAPEESKSYNRSSYYGDSRYADYPVIYVSWDGARRYCEWRGGRLPTEAEWEYAARGGLAGKRYPWGDADASCSRANHSYCVGDTSKMGSYPANGYGLYDMAGNVWEWCSDWYDENYYRNSPSRNPQGPSSGFFRVLRGGSWADNLDYVRVANRYHNNPVYRDHDVGLRCAR